ncbi:MAG: GFA family protein [Woeseiaceae bacterium]
MGSSESSRHYTGGCLCGAVRFELDEEPGPIDVCYCEMCRKASGGPLATNAPIRAAAFRFSAGAAVVSGYESSPGETRHFCSRCGSPLFSTRVDRPGVMRVRVGTINEPLTTRPAISYHTASKCNWWQILDTLPRIETE